MFKLKAPDQSNNLCARNLLYYRQKRGLSQRGLAKAMQLHGYDVDHHFVRRIETGERFVTDIELVALCKALDITLNQLLLEKH